MQQVLIAAEQTFIEESRECLSNLEQQLLNLENNLTDQEALNSLFRSVHTIKGSAAMFEYELMAEFTHELESILDDYRSGVIKITQEDIHQLLACHDHMAELLFKGKDASNFQAFRSKSEELLAGLKTTSEAPTNANITQTTANKLWHISIEPTPSLFNDCIDLLAPIKFLAKSAEIVNLSINHSQLPNDNLDCGTNYLGVDILVHNTSIEEIEDCFEFVSEAAKVNIFEPGTSLKRYLDAYQLSVQTNGSLLKQWHQAGAISADDVATIEKQIKDNDAGDVKEVSELNEKTASRQLIRIEPEKVDNLISLIGELVIGNSSLHQQISHLNNNDLSEGSLLVAKLVEEIRDSAMKLRMVQIGDTLKRFQRVISTICRESNKKIKLDIHGADTELDKTIVDKIYEPLLHLVRNAADHGIDSPEERLALGKPAEATINISAWYETGSVVIEVKDDGQGFNFEKIKSKAVAKGLAKADVDYSEKEITDFLFLPGFSTRDEVSELSGRGVGLDAVKRTVEGLHGEIYVNSIAGEGTAFTVHFPLTLAIIDGFLIRTGNTNYVLPLEMVLECVEIKPHMLRSDHSHYFSLRDQLVPYLDLRTFLDKEENDIDEENHTRNLVLVRFGEKQIGLVTDQVEGEFQAVIKPLGEIFRNLRMISGASILGSGEIAFVLDIAQLLNQVQQHEQHAIKKGAP